jgi:hypothetical protein
MLWLKKYQKNITNPINQKDIISNYEFEKI